jgi:hypothetical protein
MIWEIMNSKILLFNFLFKELPQEIKKRILMGKKQNLKAVINLELWD